MSSFISKVCCITGHRPNGFSWDYYDTNCIEHELYLKNMTHLVTALIKEGGYDWFISGGAIGVDMDFAETVIELRKYYPNIQLELALPCPNQDRFWQPNDKIRYEQITLLTNLVTVVSPTYTKWCMQKRNKYMVDKSELVIAYWNNKKMGGTFNTLTYSRKKNKPLEIVYL